MHNKFVGLTIEGTYFCGKSKMKTWGFNLEGLAYKQEGYILWHNIKKKTCVKKACVGKMCVNMKRKTCSKTCVNIFAKFSQRPGSYLTFYFWCYKNNWIIAYRIIINLPWQNLPKIFLLWCLFYSAVQLFLLQISCILFDLSHY